MKILLVNPNIMQNPPVIPIGLEYIITALEKYNHKVELLDLTFEPNSRRILQKRLNKNPYDLVGFTIRNIDSSVFFNNEFYLPEIRKLVKIVQKKGIPIVLGGAGFSAIPHEMLEYFQADYGIIGPAEIMFPKFLELLQSDQVSQNIYDGWQVGPDLDLTHLRGKKVDYVQYTSNDGIVGFSTQYGCQNQCPYCIEARTKLWLKNIPNIIEELQHIIDQGYTHFHLCDSEFNEDLDYSISFLKELNEARIPLKWTLYMKPTPYNEELFELLHETKAYLITLTVDSDERTQTINNYNYDDLATIIEYCNKYKIELAIDLLTGYPGESLESTKKVIEFFKTHRPKRVGVSFNYRIGKNTSLAHLIKNTPSLQQKLSRPYSEEEDLLEPIFYSHLDQSTIAELIDNDELFQIAGVKAGVNYQF
jgi:radical SAM superfamily enzyme YgiQ (UPF0313 family)